MTPAYIQSAASVIREFNPRLADMFLSSPFRRVQIAYAFSRGFAQSDDGDINKHAALVIEAALMDRDSRAI